MSYWETCSQLWDLLQLPPILRSIFTQTTRSFIATRNNLFVIRQTFPDSGLYPLVGWKIGNKVVYVAEGNSSGTGTAIEWAKQMGELLRVPQILK